MSEPETAREEVVPILRVQDASIAAEWYRQLDFQFVNQHRFAPGMPAFVTISRRDMTLFLSEHTGDARPNTLLYLRVRDVQALAARFDLATEVQPWGREFEIVDPDGNRLRIGTPSWW